MVRQKNRWLLVQLDFESNITSSCSLIETSTSKKRKLQTSNSSMTNESSSSAAQQSIQQITTTDIYRSLTETLTQNYGILTASTTDVKVRLYDPKVRLAIIKTSRDKYPIVRSSLTIMTQIKQGGDLFKVVVSTIGVCGSARSARNAVRLEVQKRFYGKMKGESGGKKSRVDMEKDLYELEDRLEKIDSGC